jgi:hypothetical protein
MPKQVTQQHAPRVYISHAKVDNILARKIRNLLKSSFDANVSTPEDLSAGGDWESQLRREISDSDYFVAVLTPQSCDRHSFFRILAPRGLWESR